jgi:murein DD-endopeptidase MepM/ murein hydrolase activator NlpD
MPNIAPLPRKVVDTGPQGLLSQLPAEDFYGGPSEEEMPHLTSWLNDQDAQNAPDIPQTALPSPVPKSPVGPPRYQLGDASTLLRSPERMQIREGRVHPFDPGQKGIGIGGLSPEQRAVLDSSDQHQIIQGGPGTGKTDTMIMKMLDLISSGNLDPGKIMAFSGMHSGVSEINSRFNKFLRPLLPQGEGSKIPAATTIHSLAHQINFPGGEPSPLLGKIGRGYLKDIIANPSEEELALQTPETADLMRDQQYRFLSSTLQKSFPNEKKLPTTNAQLKNLNSEIQKFKRNRIGPNSAYEKAMKQGTEELGQGKFTHSSALAAYEQNMRAEGHGDFDDSLTIAREQMEHAGAQAIPPHLRDTQLVAYDEAQDSNMENLGFVSQLSRSLGQDSKMLVGLDPMQALFQGSGSFAAKHIIPTISKMMGGATHTQLRSNYRSSKRDVALGNAVLGKISKLTGNKGLSPEQVPQSLDAGKPAHFLMEKSQPDLYRSMFQSMLGESGAPMHLIKKNILAGNHPLEGIDSDKDWSARPGESPAIFQTHAARNLFEHEAPSVLQGFDPGISPEMAKTAFKQMYRRGLPSRFAKRGEREAFDEKKYFRGMMTGESRGLAFDTPHSDVTPQGEWRKPENLESYLHNLYVQISRVKEGGQNIIGAARLPFDSRQSQTYMNTAGAHYRDTAPGSLSEGTIYYGPGKKQFLTQHPANELDTYDGRAVPAHFGDILKAQASQVATLPDVVRSNTPRLGKTPIDAKHVAMVQQLHEEFGKQKDKTWPQFMSAKVPEIKDLAGEKSHVTQFAQQMAAAPEKYAPGNVSIPGAPQSSIAPTGNVTIQAPPGGKVDVTGTQVSVSQGTAPGRQPAPSATLPPPLMTGGSSFISPIGRKIAAMGQTPSVSGSPMGAQWVAGIGEAPDTSGGSGGRKPPTLFDKATDTGRTFARIGGEMEFFGKLLDSVAQKAIDQGSDYRLASGRFAGSGATADRGFFDFANGQSGISQMQNNNLQMFSKTQIAQNLQNVASMTGGQAPPSGTSQSILQLSALTGMDPTQLTSQIGAIGGSMGQGMNATPQLAGYLGSLYKGQVSAINATPTLQAVQSALPSMQGLTFGQGNNLGALFGLMNAGISGGMTAANMPDVASLTNSLAQVGTAPGLNQQAALSQLFPGQLTGGVQLAQYQQQQSQMGEQAQQLGLQQAFNVPGLQIQINNADIAMKQANLNLSQVQFQQGQAELGLQTQQLGYSQAQLNYQNLQYQYSQAQFGQQQYVATQQYGPIGADTGRNSYFDFMRNQQAAGYNPLSAETGTQFKASAPQGIQNMQFYAGVENQRQDLILSRSPLLSDALFQQQMKNLNQQEAFYKEELDLTNEQRTFDVTWTTKLLDAQGKLLPMQQGILDTQKGMLVYTKEELSAQGTILGISQTQVGLAQQMTDYQNADLQLQQKYLPQQIAELQNIQTAMAQSIAGQGPINGANPTPQQIIRQLSLITDPTQQQNTIRNLGLPPDQVNTLNTILTGMKSAGGYDAAMKGVTPADKSVQSQVNNLVKSGAFTGQATSAAAADAALNLGGTGAQWTKFVNEFNISNGYLKSMDNALSSINDYIKGWGTFFSMAGPTLTGIGMLLQGFGIGGKLAGIGANFFTGGGAAAAGNTIKSAVTTGAQAISDAAVSAAPVLIPLIIAALGTAVITFTLKWLGDQAAAQGQKNFNNPQQAADNGPSWLSWAHTASPKAVTKAQSAQDQYRATHHGQSMPMDAGSPLAKGTLLGDAWGGIQSGASATWNWLTTPIGGAPQGKPKRTDLLNLPTNDVPSHGVHTAAPVADSNAIVKSLQAGWNAFWAGPGAKGWGSWWSDRGKDWNSWWADRKKGWDSWWTDRATGWNNWWSDRKKGWDNWWTDRAKGWDNWWIDRRKGWDAWWTDRKTDWGNWWTDRAKDWNTFWADRGKDWSKFWSDRGKDINNIWQGAVSQITNFFNPGSKSNIGTLLGNALKSIDWGKIFNIGQIFGGGSSGGGPTSGGSEPAGHPGFSTPHVNTEFHVPMSYGPHQGIDFQAAQGSNLHEFVGGIVSKTGHFDWGGEIDVKVPGGLTERYLHLSGIAVKPGQPVARGQFLGLTGGGTAASGLGYWSSGSHLHTQFDRGTYTGGLDPWPIWKAFGDMNLARYIGGGGGQLLEKFAQGGVAMTPQIASVAEIEPEAIVPLSKLSSMIKNVSASTQSTTTQTRSITVGSLIQNATFIVKSDGNGQMNDQAKDDLMHQILSILEEALQQSNGKLK